MKVTFTKLDRARYTVAATRDHGASVPARLAPGYDPYLPHDLAHFLVEVEFGIRLGVFGRLAASGDQEHTPAAAEPTRRSRRNAHRVAENASTDTIRSERLVALCQPLWEARSGRKPGTPTVIDMKLATPFDVDRTMKRFDEISERWTALRPGESITLEWPEALSESSPSSASSPAGASSGLGRQLRDRPTRRVAADAVR
jgi:hypothetical protein